MSHKNKLSIKKIISDALTSQIAFGQSKHADKTGAISSVLTDGRIYSYQTLHNYLKTMMLMVKELREQNIKLCCLEDIRKYAPLWLQGKIIAGKSAATVKTYAAAIAKTLHCSINDFDIDLPKRSRTNITRSRFPAKRDLNFDPASPKNAGLLAVLRVTGLRRKEAMYLTKDCLVSHDEKYFLKIKKGTKGGKPREIPFCGTKEEIQKAVAVIQSSSGSVFKHRINTNIDIHSIRREYAQRLYRHYLAVLPKENPNTRLILYHNHLIGKYVSSSNFRCDPDKAKEYCVLKGGCWSLKPGFRDVSVRFYPRENSCKAMHKWYSRTALLAVSAAMGHNRESITMVYLL